MKQKILKIAEYLLIMAITILVGSYAIAFLAEKQIEKTEDIDVKKNISCEFNAPHNLETCWDIVEWYREEGYRRGYIRGWVDKSEGNKFDDSYDF